MGERLRMHRPPGGDVSAMRRHNVDLLIHGHTHRPAIHAIDVGKSGGVRIVLGDWYEQASVLEVSSEKLELSASGLSGRVLPAITGWVVESDL